MHIDDGEKEVVENDFSAFEKVANAAEDDGPEQEDSEEEKPEKPSPETDNPEAEEPESEEDDDSEDEDAEEAQPKKKTASDRIRELNRKLREVERARDSDRRGFEARLEKIEKQGLTPENSGGTSDDAGTPPDPRDLKKYPLGSLDDRYIQDAIAFTTQQSVKEAVDSLLQRQEQSAEQAEAERFVTELRSKADDVAAKGSEIYDDYEDVVLAAGLRGDYDLTQTTFEAAAEAENGAQILYGLATDPAEATRVARLSSFQQLKYVSEKNAEFAKGKQGKKIPGAISPPGDTPRGRSKRTTISADTTDFAEFERLARSR